MSNASKTARKAAVEAAVTLAQRIAETKNIDAGTLETITAGLNAGIELADGGAGGEELDSEIAEMMGTAFGTVERSGPLWTLQHSVARKVLARLQPEEVDELVRATAWADDGPLPDLALRPLEPWEEAAVPVLTLSAPEPREPADLRVDVPQEPENRSETVEVVEAELVDEPEEIEQTTSSQRRYRMPPGQGYVPPRRFGQRLGDGGRERAAAQAQFGADVFLEGD